MSPAPIKPEASIEDLGKLDGHEHRASWLRLRTLDLGRREPGVAPAPAAAVAAPLAVRTCHRTIRGEIDALPEDVRERTGKELADWIRSLVSHRWD